MAKTESTAVTRLIELAQQRSPDGDTDWFAPPRPKRIAREEVTQVVRIARRALRVHPGLVIGAFVAGMATVLLTTWVTREPAVIAQVPTAAPAAAAAGRTVVTPVAVPAPPAPREPIPIAVAVVAPEPEPEPAPVAEPEPAPIVVERVAPAPRTRPAAPHPAAPRAKHFKPAAPPRRPSTGDAGPLSELRISSKPPCQLYIDGRSYGWTPQRGISVAPGRHTVVFRNREQGVERKVIVDAKVGQVHKLIRDFTQP